MIKVMHGIALVCLLCGTLQPVFTGRRASAAEVADGRTPEGEGPISVAALPFRNASADEQLGPLADAIGDMLMVRLSAAEGLAFVERAALDKLLAEHELSAIASPADQVRLGRMVGARFVLTGSVTAVGDKLQITAHLLDVASRRVARSAKVTAEIDRLVQSTDELARELTDAVNWKLPELTQDQIDKSPEASLYFMRGLGYHRAGMPERAATQFMKTLAVDPGHARARFWSAMTFLDQDQHGHAKIEFARFLERFGQHPLAPRAKELLKQCEAQTTEPREGGPP
ncbi:MAG: FlgO family outer membrane protein [Planctomycetota bacterium]|jgi:TolB-like protein